MRAKESQDAVNADSFLDIVASVVSIMLIMVMMVGMRVRTTSVDDLVSAGVEEVEGELQEQLATEESVRADVLRAAVQIKALKQETAVKASQRDVLGVTIAALEHDLRARREKLGAGDQRNFDLVRNVALAKQQLGELERQRQAVDDLEPPAEEIKHLPTPISQKVDRPQKCFLVSRGRIIHVPMNLLIEAVKRDAERKRLDANDEVSGETSAAGFRVEYEVQVNRHGMHGIPNWVERGYIFPTSDLLGEPIAEALGPHSQFRSELDGCRPGRDAILIWVHADSFGALRPVRDELHRLKHAVAIWPLPNGAPIAVGSDGDKSAAQ